MCLLSYYWQETIHAQLAASLCALFLSEIKVMGLGQGQEIKDTPS